MSIPVEYIETVETTADGEEIHIAHSGGDLEGSTVILDPVLQVSATDSLAVSVNHLLYSPFTKIILPKHRVNWLQYKEARGNLESL